ncbi:MAG: hypothetical protein ACEPOW_03645 [Bacteroidales bacterium]
MKKIKYILIPTGFILFLIFPKINVITHWVKPLNLEENRIMSEKPDFNITNLDPFPMAYEKYYNDNFCLKSNFVGRYNYFKFRLNKKSPNPKSVLVGKKDFFFYNDQSIKIVSGIFQYSKEQLDAFKKEIQSRTELLKKENCKYYLAIIPTKGVIYNEYLPDDIQVVKKNIRSTEILIKYLRDNGCDNVIYLQSALEEAKKKHRIFHKHDNHWNNNGAFAATTAIQKRIQKDFPNVRIYDLKDYTIRSEKVNQGGDLANIIGLSPFLTETKFKYIPNNDLPQVFNGNKKNYPIPEGFAYGWGYEVQKRTENDSLPKLMVVNNSFGPYTNEFLSRSFSKSVYIWDKWEFKLNDDIRRVEKPDVFLTLITDFSLDALLKK